MFSVSSANIHRININLNNKVEYIGPVSARVRGYLDENKTNVFKPVQ